MLLNRNELISALFRETDRAQRTKAPLAVIYCGICEWEGWRAQATETTVSGALQEIAERITRLLRCYDWVGQVGDGELVLLLPGCNSFNASTLAVRLNTEVFAMPQDLDRSRIRFSACFGVAVSGGRSPFVVLSDAERAYQVARSQGAGSVSCCATDAESDPAGSLLGSFENEKLRA